jgi:WD40 repeat protein
MVSGDERGTIRVWAFDHPEHLVKYEKSGALTGAIRDADWDDESKRLAIGGERVDARSQCAIAIQWDGVTAGQLSQFQKGRVASVAFKKQRPFRIVTAGMDEPKCAFHKGPPFQKIPSENGVPAESEHTRGGVQCVRYNSSGSLVVSVSSDKSICLYDGTTFEKQVKVEGAHDATIYACDWARDDAHILTASGDGTCKLWAVTADSITELKVWKPADIQNGGAFEKVPVGGIQLGCAFVNGEIPVSVGYNGQITVMSTSTDAMDVRTGHYAPISAMAVDEINGVFFTGDTNGILCKWNLETTKCVTRLTPPEGNSDLMYVVHGNTERPAAISGVAVTTSKFYSVGWDDKMYVADSEGMIQKDAVDLGAQPKNISTGTDLAVIVTVNGILLVTDGKTSDMIPIPYEANCSCVSTDDKTVYIGGNDAKIYVYTTNGSSLKENNVIDGKHLKPVHSIALSNDGLLLASGDEKDICVFNTSDWSTVVARGRWCFHVQKIMQLAWSPDNKILASGGADDSIYLWSVEHKAKRVHYGFAHRGGVMGLHFLQKAVGVQFLSVGADSVVNRWDATKDIAEKFV